MNNTTVIALLSSLAKHQDWVTCSPEILEREMDIPVADVGEEEEGYFMMRTDRVLEVVGAMEYLISKGLVKGDIRPNKDRFICAGIKLTDAGKDHTNA